MKKDIQIKWSKKESDFIVEWNDGCGRDARCIFEEIVGSHKGSKLFEELRSRGYDLETIKFSVSKPKANP